MPIPPRPLFTAGQTLVLEGDSRTSRRVPPALATWPWLRLNNWHVTWADRFEEWIFCHRPDLRLKIHNAAVGGSAVEDLVQRYEVMVKPLQPDWVLLTIGQNDRVRGTTPAAFRAALARYAAQVRADSGGRLVVIVTHPPGRYGEPAADCADWLAALRDAVGPQDGLCVDLTDALAERERALKALWAHHTLRTYEDEHFNAVGADVIAILVLQACGLLLLSQGEMK